MSKIGEVRKGWKLLRVLSIRVEPAKLYTGKLSQFVPSVVSEDGKTVIERAKWVSSPRWLNA